MFFLFFLFSAVSFCQLFRSAILTGYPQSNLNASIHEFIGLLPTFCRETIRMGTYEERVAAREKFSGLLPKKFADTTLIGDTTHFPVISRKNDQYQGPNSMWSYKLKKLGI
jgi:hypothetical protein